ncbi:MAG TPA: imidazole glycerol phosphate synthase subunit HisF [Thermoanaerobaculia bacterium]|nr:imidazole glycerol phosphate synthase subunit HisF [Thermoanaerobaculia bacterium]
MNRATGLKVRIVPCLDVRDGRVVKGTRFANLRDAGDPVEAAARYAMEGADEIVYLDVSATPEGRSAVREVVERTARSLFVPLTVGGGVRGAADAERLLRSGADRISVNSAAVVRPELVDELARAFGSQCVVLAVDALRARTSWTVWTEAGRRDAGRDALAWAREGADRGAGEILLTSIDRDGTGRGYDLELLEEVVAAVNVPVIASGGVGSYAHMLEGARGGAAALLVAGTFHRGELTIRGAKEALARAGVPVRTAA